MPNVFLGEQDVSGARASDLTSACEIGSICKGEWADIEQISSTRFELL
jgi:hypothetical protein